MYSVSSNRAEQTVTEISAILKILVLTFLINLFEKS